LRGDGHFAARTATIGTDALPCQDQDADGYADCSADCDATGIVCGDCDDADPNVYPGAEEVCNHRDDNCDGQADEGFPHAAGGQKVADPREPPGDQFGSTVATIGDVTGDGVSDIAVAALIPREVAIVSGADRSVVCRMSDPASGSRFGAALAGIGDVTGDGVPDVAVGEPSWDSSQVRYNGVVGIFSGADCSWVENCSDIVLGCGPTGNDNCYSALGSSVTAIGDVTGDGSPDFVAGDPGFSSRFSNGLGIGSVVVFSSGCAVVARLQAPVTVQFGGFGRSVANIGDLDRDGVPDFAVGTSLESKAYLFSGANRSLIRTLVETTTFIGSSFAGLPDLDGDGVPEIAAGAPFYDSPTGSLAGGVVIYSGATGTRLRRCADPSGLAGDSLGLFVANMGDLTGDGVPEIVAAAPGRDSPAGSDAGSINLFSAGDCSLVRRMADPTASPGEQLGSGGVARVGDVSGDGVPEWVAGAPLDDAGRRLDSGSVVILGLQSDCDGDDWTPFGGDCDDGDPTRNPGVVDVCDGLDNDCDGLVDESGDGDPVGVCDDCDDRDMRIYPGAPEVCDGLDNNCNAQVDEGVDRDGDGVSTPCDCNDADPAIRPGATERCNLLDDDCDGQVDEGVDQDGDGVTIPCDCNDADRTVHPGAPEQCNLVDDDCDDRVDEEHPLYQTIHGLADPSGASGDGFGSAVTGLGDVTGDGVPDYAVGAPGDDTPQGMNAGSVLVFSGQDRSPLCRLFDPAGGFGEEAGISLGALGDVTGDGVPDVAVGASGYRKPEGQGSGSVLIFSGKDCTMVRRCVDPALSNGLGRSVAGIPDLDGDGAPDLVAGAPAGDGGQVLVFSGRDCSLIHRLTGPAAGTAANLGWAVTGLADVTGDGVADIAAGDLYADTQAGAQSGRVLIFSGSDGTLVRTLTDPAGGSFAGFGYALADLGDLDRDGVTDLLIANYYNGVFVFSGSDGSLLRLCPGFLPAVARLDDITGDGLPEMIVGDLIFGTSSVPSAGRIMVLSGADCSLVASLTDPLAQGYDRIGWPLAVAGDQDGDGLPEILGGSPMHDTSAGQDAGEALLFGLEGDCDADGFTRNTGDCDDGNPNSHPGAPETCNGVDEDCNGIIDDGSADPDRDGVCGEADNCPTIPNPDQNPEACLQQVVDITIDFKSPLGRGAGTVAWRTTHEVDLLGFDIVIIGPQGKRTQLNSARISCEACVTGEGVAYTFTIPKRRSGRDIFIEAVRSNGIVERFGPAQPL
jgi:hypothetical protein